LNLSAPAGRGASGRWGPTGIEEGDKVKRKELEKQTVAELRKMARSEGLSGVSRMRKAELVSLLAAMRPATNGPRSKKRASKPRAAGKNAAKRTAAKGTRPKNAAKRTAAKGTRPKKAAKRTAARGTRSKKAAGKPRAASTKATKRTARKGSSPSASRPAVSPTVKRAFGRAKGRGEQRAKTSKYYLGRFETAEFEDTFEYPETYGESAISLMVRDPYWLFTYWEFGPDLRSELVARIGEEALLRSRTVLRVYDVTGSDPEHAEGHYDIDIAREARNWYINVPRVERDYCVDIGLIVPDGTFITIARSNTVSLPPVGPSEAVDEEWVAIDALSDLYLLVDEHRGGPTSGSGGWGSGGFGR